MAFFRLDNTGKGFTGASGSDDTYTNNLAAQTNSHPYIISNACSHAINYRVTATTGSDNNTVRIGKVNFLDNHTDGAIVWLTETSAEQSGGTAVTQTVDFVIDKGDTDTLVIAVNGSTTWNVDVSISNVQARHGTSASQHGRLYISEGNDVAEWTAS